jgi:hypothetical protein
MEEHGRRHAATSAHVVWWMITCAVLLGVAAFADPARAAAWSVHTTVGALGVATLAGTYALGYAVVGVVARGLSLRQVAGSVLLALGLFLVGLHFLPHTGVGAQLLTSGGVALFIAGLAWHVREARRAQRARGT